MPVNVGKPMAPDKAEQPTCTTSAPSVSMQALPSICRKMLVFSGSNPDTTCGDRKMQAVLPDWLCNASVPKQVHVANQGSGDNPDASSSTCLEWVRWARRLQHQRYNAHQLEQEGDLGLFLALLVIGWILFIQ